MEKLDDLKENKIINNINEKTNNLSNIHHTSSEENDLKEKNYDLSNYEKWKNILNNLNKDINILNINYKSSNEKSFANKLTNIDFELELYKLKLNNLIYEIELWFMEVNSDIDNIIKLCKNEINKVESKPQNSVTNTIKSYIKASASGVGAFAETLGFLGLSYGIVKEAGLENIANGMDTTVPMILPIAYCGFICK